MIELSRKIEHATVLLATHAYAFTESSKALDTNHRINLKHNETVGYLELENQLEFFWKVERTRTFVERITTMKPSGNLVVEQTTCNILDDEDFVRVGNHRRTYMGN